MLTDDNIKTIAKKLNKQVGVIEKDYALEWLLYGLYHKKSPMKDLLVFKGGTAIRKVFFPNLGRFSEDLDFSIVPKSDYNNILNGNDAVYEILRSEVGITYEGEFKETKNKNAIFGEVHYTGPLRQKNKIKFSVSLTEKLAEKSGIQKISPTYSDLKRFSVMCYLRDEILAEKIRSLMQRPRARDYYDVWKMFTVNNFDVKIIATLVLKKCKLNKIEYSPEIILKKDRLDEIRSYWKSDLKRLIDDELPDPDMVFVTLEKLLNFLPKK